MSKLVTREAPDFKAVAVMPDNGFDVDALRFHEERGQVCPADWREGREAMQPTSEGVVDYLSRFARRS